MHQYFVCVFPKFVVFAHNLQGRNVSCHVGSMYVLFYEAMSACCPKPTNDVLFQYVQTEHDTPVF